MKIKDLYVEHDYYCNGQNYYSNEASASYKTVTDFLDALESVDVDLNLCFRWDIRERDDNGYCAEVFLILQRKGLFRPISIEKISDDEVDRFVEYLKKHKAKLDSIWSPIK